MPEKFKRCVRKVKAQNGSKPSNKQANPYAVCHAAIKDMIGEEASGHGGKDAKEAK